MKKVVILLLAIALAACSTPAAQTAQPAAVAPVEPSATPVVVVQTVVVEATQAPTQAPAPTAQPPVVVTVVVQPTQEPAQPAATVAQPAAGNAPIAIDNALGRGVYSNMTMSSNAFTLRCAPRDITFNVTASNIDIVDTVFYYRIVDIKRQYPKDWKAFGKMTANGNGNFTLTFKGDDVNPDYRLDGSWFDFQFVGLSKTGDVVDRTEKIEQLVKYTFDCP